MSASRKLPVIREAALAAGAVAFMMGLIGTAHSQTAKEFYENRTIRFIVGGAAGGGYDFYARVLANHMPRHLPGNANIIVENMPGAGGVKGTNYFYNVAPRDGSVLGMPFFNNPVFQLIRPEGIRFDARQFQWVGNMAELNSVVAVHESVPVQTVEAARETEVILSASGKGAETYIYPTLLNAIAGTRFRLVMGYPGTAAMTVAIERGEVQGRGGSWMSWKSIRPDWVRDRQIRVIAQAGLRKDPDLPDIPLFLDLATTPEDRAMVQLLSLPIATSRAVPLPPEVPADRVELVRRAFDATLRDPEFLKEAAERRMDIKAMTGEEVQAAIEEMFQTPPEVIERAKAALDY